MEGVRFELYNSSGQVVQVGTTDETGTIVWEDLEIDTYNVQETYSNGLEYTLTPPYSQYITFENDGEEKEVSFYNDPPSTLRVHKVDAETGVGLEGVQIWRFYCIKLFLIFR